MRSVCSEKFVRVVAPALAAGDVEKLRRDVNEHWTPHELCGLLADPQVDVRRAAAVTLGLVGGSAVVGCLTKALRDPDARVHRDAEDALWSVWFRGGCATAGQAFQDGMRALADDRLTDAQERLEQATEIDSSFSEAFQSTGHRVLFAKRLVGGD